MAHLFMFQGDSNTVNVGIRTHEEGPTVVFHIVPRRKKQSRRSRQLQKKVLNIVGHALCVLDLNALAEGGLERAHLLGGALQEFVVVAETSEEALLDVGRVGHVSESLHLFAIRAHAGRGIGVAEQVGIGGTDPRCA